MIQKRCHMVDATLLSLLVLLLLPGCWASSKSSGLLSNSSGSLSASFSNSLSRSSSREAAYREDVRDYTAAHLQSGGTIDELRRQIASLAAKHGITDWENNESTFRAIGAGLAKAGYRQVQVDAFKKNMASTDAQAKWIQKGYDTQR